MHCRVCTLSCVTHSPTHYVIYSSVNSFDMAHFGHANALRQAKKLGDYLIVGIHSDGMEAWFM